MASAVSFKKINKKFGDISANKNVTFDIEQNSIHAIVGENGAGKSTTVKILFGYQTPTSGHIEIDGIKRDIHNSEAALRLSINMVHQHFMLVNAMTVLDNILIGNPILKAGSIIDKKSSIAFFEKKSAEYNLKFNFNEYVRDMSVGAKQRLEIFKAILKECKILILDEPSSVLTKLEVQDLFSIIRRLKAAGTTVIIITHKLDEVMEISDAVTVMRGGEVIETIKTSDTSMQDLAGKMVGHKVPPIKRTEIKPGEVVLSIRKLTYPKKTAALLNNVSLDVRSGEIIGIAGISGNGQGELEQIVSGMIVKNFSGEVLFKNKNINSKSSADLRQTHIAHIPSDRTKWGYVAEWTNKKNAFLGYQFWSRFNIYKFWLNNQEINKYTEDVLVKFNVSFANPQTLTKSLSGGNQQKLIVGRELNSAPELLIIADPTQGVDIGSVNFIHQQIIEAKKEKKAILLISSELNEIKELADRAFVMHKGEIVGEIDWQKDDEKDIGLMMIGESAHKNKHATVN